jgi:uncharacterized protein (DUF736 family)
MAIIGKFESYNDQYHGQIETISGQIGVRFVRTNATGANAPTFKLVTDNGYDVGAAWPATANGKDYLSVQLDGPFTPHPIYAALFANRDGTFDLIWTALRPHGVTLARRSQPRRHPALAVRPRAFGILPEGSIRAHHQNLNFPRRPSLYCVRCAHRFATLNAAQVFSSYRAR